MDKLTKEQRIVLTGYTGVLHGCFSDFHEDVEKRLGRSVMTHEFVGMREELKQLYFHDFLHIASGE